MDRAKVARFLASAGGSRDHPELLWTVEALRAAAKASIGRAAGPNDWSAESLLLLPGFSATFGLFAMRKVSCPRCGHVLTFDRSVFFMPWRIGAKCLVSRLRCWVDGILGSRTLGGVHGRSVRDAYHQLLRAAENEQVVIAEDLTRFFGSEVEVFPRSGMFVAATGFRV